MPKCSPNSEALYFQAQAKGFTAPYNDYSQVRPHNDTRSSKVISTLMEPFEGTLMLSRRYRLAIKDFSPKQRQKFFLLNLHLLPESGLPLINPDPVHVPLPECRYYWSDAKLR